MKKITKVVTLVLIAVFALFPYINVFASTYDMKITTKSYIKVNKENDNDDRREAYYLTDRGYAFCITPEKTGAKEGMTFNYAGTETNNTLLYLLSYGNDDNEYQYLIKQLAIWKAVNNFTPAYYLNNSSLELLKDVDNLVEKARNSKADYSAETAVELEYDGSKFEIADINGIQYYKSGMITVSLTNAMSTSYELDAPNGTRVFDANGSDLKVISNGTKFYIAVPLGRIQEEINLSITVNAKGLIKYADRYTATSGDWQDLVILNERETSASNKMSLKIGNKQNQFICEKVDGKYYGKDGKETDLETYLNQCITRSCEVVEDKYLDKNGNVTDEETFLKQCFKHTCEIIDGDYYDAAGNISSYDDYKIQCETLVCEIVKDKYFGAYGKEVSQSEFKSQCEAQIVYVPDTKVTSIISVIIGILMLSGVALFVKKQSNN